MSSRARPDGPAGLLPLGPAAHVEQLLATIDALQAEMSNLRELADARRYHMEQVERELRLAARLQRDFLPKRLPNHGRLRFNRLFRPAGHVSGDLYDVRRLDEQHAGVYLADAIGHGMPAALLAMFMHNALVTKRIDADHPGGYRLLDAADAMQALNDTLCGQDLANGTFATAVYAKVNIQTGEVDLARGGHPHPLLIRPNGTIRPVGGEGALLGVMRDEPFIPERLVLEPGDRLIFYTDGVETAYVGPGEPGDMDRWLSAIADRRDLPADELLSELWQHLEARPEPAKDDITVVTIERPE